METSLWSLFVLLVIYACLGFAVEAIYTGLKDWILAWWNNRLVDRQLPCRVSLWIFLVYGVSATISYSLIGGYAPEFLLWPRLLRGVIYIFGFWLWEFAWAFAAEELFKVQLWKYKESPYRIWRYISLRHAPLWFGLGLAFEGIQTTILPRLLNG